MNSKPQNYSLPIPSGQEEEIKQQPIVIQKRPRNMSPWILMFLFGGLLFLVGYLLLSPSARKILMSQQMEAERISSERAEVEKANVAARKIRKNQKEEKTLLKSIQEGIDEEINEETQKIQANIQTHTNLNLNKESQVASSLPSLKEQYEERVNQKIKLLDTNKNKNEPAIAKPQSSGTGTSKNVKIKQSTKKTKKKAHPKSKAHQITPPLNIDTPEYYLKAAKALYVTEDKIKARADFHNARLKFLSEQNVPAANLVKYNINLDGSQDQVRDSELRADYERVRNKFNLDEITTELPMCIIIPTYNNNKNNRIQYNLNSVFNQNYSNYKVVIMEDVTTDGTKQFLKRYRKFYQIPKDKAMWIFNKERKTALGNIFFAATKYCDKDSYGLNLDGDDELIGRNVLKVFNAEYQRKKAGVLYSNFLWYAPPEYIKYGFTAEYTDEEKKNQGYRMTSQKFSHLRSFKVSLFRQIFIEDLLDEDGSFFTVTADFVTMYPLMDLACGHVHQIQEYHYLYNMGTGLNDYQIDNERQLKVGDLIKARKPYPCSEQMQF